LHRADREGPRGLDSRVVSHVLRATVVPDAPEATRRLRCLAIIPAYNEEEAVAGVIAELASLDIDALVVDDGSADGTFEVARAAGARVVRLPFNLGIGAAVQTGYMAALAGGYDVAIQVDGDGQHPATEIPKLLVKLQESGADLVVGSRFVGSSEFRSSRTRRAGISLFARVISMILRVPMTDTTSGFRAAGPRAIRLFADLYPHDYPEVEAILIAARSGLTVVETPISMRERQGGRSSIRPIHSAYYMLKVMLAIGMTLLRRPEQAMKVDE
jgi:glycosyltransferase involved in cell wall biosynthesis